MIQNRHTDVNVLKYSGIGSIEYRTRKRVENLEECARRCLLGTKCDMFTTVDSWNQCIYYPHLKLKHLPLYQVEIYNLNVKSPDFANNSDQERRRYWVHQFIG